MTIEIDPRHDAELAFDNFLEAENISADIHAGIETATECARAFHALDHGDTAAQFDELVKLYRELGGDPDGETTIRAVELAQRALGRS